MSDIKELQQKLADFRDAREWKQFHNPKDLAMAISIESAELLEVFLWKSPEEGKEEKIREELADVINYCLLMADACGLDVKEIVEEKIKKTDEKYPVEMVKGSARKYNEY